MKVGNASSLKAADWSQLIESLTMEGPVTAAITFCLCSVFVVSRLQREWVFVDIFLQYRSELTDHEANWSWSLLRKANVANINTAFQI